MAAVTGRVKHKSSRYPLPVQILNPYPVFDVLVVLWTLSFGLFGCLSASARAYCCLMESSERWTDGSAEMNGGDVSE